MKETSYLGLSVEPVKNQRLEGTIYMTACECTPIQDDTIDFKIITFKDGKKKVLCPVDLDTVCILAGVKSFYSFKANPEKFKEALQELSGIKEEIVLTKSAKRKLWRIMKDLNERYKLPL